jgi:hypothetical protein
MMIKKVINNNINKYMLLKYRRIELYQMDPTPELSLGEELTVLVLKGKGDSIISRMKDGRVILFNRENVLFQELEPGMTVKAKVSFIAQNYIIVDPVEPPERGKEAIKLGLIMVSETENWENAVMANALLHIIELLEEEP